MSHTFQECCEDSFRRYINWYLCSNLIVICVFLLHTLAVKVNWKFLCFILLLVAWKSVRADPMLTCCHAFNLSVDFHATVYVCANVCSYTWHVYLKQVTRKKFTVCMYIMLLQNRMQFHLTFFIAFILLLFILTVLQLIVLYVSCCWYDLILAFCTGVFLYI